MKQAIGTVTLLGAMVCCGLCGCDREVEAVPQAQPTQVELVARGRYLVENVAMCADCHSQRGRDGAFVKERWLLGGPIEFAPVHEMPAWAAVAPPITGAKVYTEEHLTTLLTTGARPDGSHPRPPMPPYRMTQEDAAAVVAYLRSLGGS